MTRGDFFKNVYRLVRRVPSGKIATYGQIAEMLGTRDARRVEPRTALTSRQRPSSSRSRRASIRGKWAISPQLVGFALHANNDPNVPCHRVVNKDGRLAPNFAFDGYKEQRRRLLAEGINFKDEMHVDLEKHLWVLK